MKYEAWDGKDLDNLAKKLGAYSIDDITFTPVDKDYQDEPFNTLETDPAFIERRDRLCKVLGESTLKSDLAWLINRAYYVGYQNGLKDFTDENNNKGDKENE